MSVSELPKRTRRALDLRVVEVSENNYLVQSQRSDEDWYSVVVHEIGNWNCGCRDFRYRESVCKHIRAAVLAEERGDVENV